MSDTETLADALLAACRRHDGPFVEGSGLRADRACFERLAANRRAALAAAGLRAGAAALILSGRGNRFWVDLVAVWSLGAIAVPVDPFIRPQDAEVITSVVSAALIIGTTAHEVAAFAHLPVLDEDCPATPPEVDPVAADPGQTAAILFTSGSTGRPKGVELSHRALLGNSRSILSALAPAAGGRLLIAIPFHFTSAIAHFLAAALGGQTLIAIEEKQFQSELFRSLLEHRATCFGGAPLQLRWIAECAANGGAPPLDWMMSSGDHLAIETIGLLRRHLPDSKVFTVYGLTELGGRLCILPASEIDTHAGSVGRPIAGMTVVVRDEDGAPLPPGQMGEVYASGQWLFKGYLGNSEATAASLGPHGFRTGDLGHLDGEGRLTLVGRADDVIKVSGQKVSLRLVADTLMESGLFADVTVVPFEHPISGTVPCALYVPRPGVTVTKGAALKFLRSRLPTNHLPHTFREMTAIPRTGSGKVLRGVLRAQLAETA